MIDGQFTTSFVVDQTPEEAFAVNNVRGWWSGDIDGDSCTVGDEFTYRYADVYRSRQRVNLRSLIATGRSAQSEMPRGSVD